MSCEVILVASNVSPIWVQSPSIMLLIVWKSAACAVTSVLWDIRKGCVLEENLMQSVVCRTMYWRGVMLTAVVCRGVPDKGEAWSCTRGWCAYVHLLSFNFLSHKAWFFVCNVGKLWCASICCVKQTMRKCLKISVKTLLFQIFFVYLPAFMRVMPSRMWSTRRVKCLKTNNLECNKAEINNF